MMTTAYRLLLKDVRAAYENLANKHENLRGMKPEDTYINDTENIKKSKIEKLERMYTEDELYLLLMSYMAVRLKKGKKTKLSKFVDWMLKK